MSSNARLITRQRLQGSIDHSHVCRSRKHRDEATARRCLWAIGQQRRINIDRLTVKRCRLCGAWHIVRRAA